MDEGKRRSVFSDNESIGWITSFTIHLFVILFILYLPHFVREPQEEAYEGVLVSFGLPVETASAENEDQQAIVTEEELPEVEELDSKIQEEELVSTLADEESEVVVKSTEEQKPQDKKPSQVIPAEEVSEEDKLDQAKDSYSQFFNTSNNKSKNAQNTGDPLGEPDATILEGISRGKGRVGGGLDERGVLVEPTIIEQSQKSGRVVVYVCVNKNGSVTSARYTQKGSTTTDSELVEIAVLSAKKYKFTSSDFDEQCGTISINFIVK